MDPFFFTLSKPVLERWIDDEGEGEKEGDRSEKKREREWKRSGGISARKPGLSYDGVPPPTGFVPPSTRPFPRLRGGIHWARIHFRFQGLSKALVQRRYCFPWIGREEAGLKIMGEDETEEVKVGRVELREGRDG